MPRRSSTSMKDVATLAGVSLGTVSNVVNSPGLVSAATRDRVELAIKKLGWIPNESARQLRAGRSRVISVVLMDISNPFFTDVLRGVEDWFQGRGYHVQASNSASLAQRESDQLRVLEQQRVGGVLWAPVRGPSERAESLRRRGIPVVIVDRARDEAGYCSVSVDDVEGGRLATEHLLALGHTAIAMVGGPGSLHQVRDRRLGAEIARGRHGGSASLLTVTTPSMEAASGVAAADQLVALPQAERPTAVFAMNDLLAIGLLQGFVTHGLRVPADVALIGYDALSCAASAAVPLSSVRQPRADLGQRAAQLLSEEMTAADHDLPHEHQNVRFTPELVVRRSTAVVASRGSTTA